MPEEINIKPNCYKCEHRGKVPGSCHSNCKCIDAKVEGREFGIRKGWFSHPYDFDPTWLISCNKFQEK